MTNALNYVCNWRGEMPREVQAEARAELSLLRERSTALSNLLAVIHRDGGQYEQDHDIRTAAQTAEEIVLQLRTGLQDARQRIAELENDLRYLSSDHCLADQPCLCCARGCVEDGCRCHSHEEVS